MNISAEEEVSINELLRKENAFYKIMLKLRSVLSKKNVEQLYNDDLLGNASKTINKDKTPVLNYKFKQFDYGFYQKLVALKDVANYFKQYLTMSEDEMGEYYVTLVSIAAPSFAEQTNKVTDPYTLSENEIDNSKLRDNLVQVLDDCLKTMKDEVRSALFQSVYQTLWFIKFVNLPFEQFIALFQKTGDGVYCCPFSISYDVYNEFVPVLINQKEFTQPMFEAIFEFNVKKNRIKNAQGLSKEIFKKQFLEKCLILTNNILDFYSKDEVMMIGRIINNTSSWSPEKIEFSTDWLATLRNSWAHDIFKRWKEWIQDVRKKKLKDTITRVFNLMDFPLLENRPWTTLRSTTEFSKEFTVGLIFWFVKNNYDDTIAFFRRIQKEGDFASFTTKNSWAEGINLFEVSSNNILDLGFKLAPNGKYGQIFQELATGKMQYFRAQTQIENIMTTIEKEVQQIVDTFAKACRTLDFCMEGFENYGKTGASTEVGLRNLDAMGGTQHIEWTEKFHKMLYYFKHLVYLISELLLIDGVKTGYIEE